MPAFNITPRKKYLAISFNKYEQIDSFKDACKVYENGTIYEKLGRGERADWYLLATVIGYRVMSEIMGDLPKD